MRLTSMIGAIAMGGLRCGGSPAVRGGGRVLKFRFGETMEKTARTEEDDELLRGLRRLAGRMIFARSPRYPTDRLVAGETLLGFEWERDDSAPSVYCNIYRFTFLGSRYRLVISDERKPVDVGDSAADDFSQIDLHEDGILVASGRMMRCLDENGIDLELHPHTLLFAAARGRWTTLLELTEKQMTAEAMEMLRRHTNN
jgi:hypothetical protein